MRIHFASALLSFDVWLLEPAPAEDEPAVQAVAGSPAADVWPAPPAPDALQKIDELPDDRRRVTRGIGYTSQASSGSLPEGYSG